MAGKTYTLTINVNDEDLEKLNKEVEKLDANVERTEESVKDLGDTVQKETKQMKKNTSAASTGFRRFGNVIKNVGQALKRAFSSGILIIITALVAAFKDVQPVVDFFDTILTGASVVGKRLYDAFALFSEGELWDGVKALGYAFTALWDGTASQISDARKQAALLRAEYEKTRTEAELGIEQNRQARDDTSKSFDLRIQQNAEILTSLETLNTASNAYYQNQINRIRNENAALGETPERMAEIASLQAEMTATQVANTTQQTEAIVQRNALTKESMELDSQLAASRTQFAMDRKYEIADEMMDVQERYDEYRGLEIERYNLENQRIQERKQQSQVNSADYKQALIEEQELFNEHNNVLTAIEKERTAVIQAENEARKQIARDTAQQSLSAASSAFGMLAELYEGDFEKQKKFKIAQAVVDTIQGAVAAYTGAASIPIVGVGIGAILAALVLATGFKQIQKIKATTPDSTSQGSGGFGGSGSISAAPSFSLIQPLDSGEVNTPVQGGGDAVPPVQAQVVSSNVSSGQALDRQVESNSTL